MTHTKSELKKALGICSRLPAKCFTECPYKESTNFVCFQTLNGDALEYIMELETENKRLFEIAMGSSEV